MKALLPEAVAPSTVLAVGAHPDDVDFGAAGTLAAWADAGSRVVYCVVTDGGAGGFDPKISREAMRELRRREQREAAAKVGAVEVVFLGYSDGEVVVSKALRRDLARVIRQVRPEVVICQSPERRWDGPVQTNHPDHLATGAAVLAAVYPDARNPFAHPELAEEGLAPHLVEEVWLYGSPQPNLVIDITKTLERKLEAITSHDSQLPGGKEQVSRRVLGTAQASALDRAGRRGSYAEEFQVVYAGEQRPDNEQAKLDLPSGEGEASAVGAAEKA